ncbi:hypothetical protein GB993_07015 [Lactobacillus rossiae]|uniref:Uncharacterized protein n=2 Tax=Furfurilactobacillus milii TaxID=2888272 RepID=A0A6N9I276_9LACO|nr:hypothetical protein [Furfurilactobacillus milii]
MDDIFGSGKIDILLRALLFYGVNNPNTSSQWHDMKTSLNSAGGIWTTGIMGAHPTWMAGSGEYSGSSNIPLPTVRTVLPGEDLNADESTQERHTGVTYSVDKFDDGGNPIDEENEYSIKLQDVIDFINANGGKNALNSVDYHMVSPAVQSSSDDDSSDDSNTSESDTNNDDGSDDDTSDSDVSSDTSNDSSNSDDQNNNQNDVNSNDNDDGSDN